MRALSSRTWLITVPVLLLVLAFYGWTAATSADLGFDGRSLDPSNLQAEAFLDGQTNLELPIPAGLLHSPDPQDPAQRGALSSDYHDLLYTEGRLYAYWGPVPALTLFAPAQLLGADRLPQALVVLLYASVAFLLSVALLWFLLERFVPRTPPWVLPAGALLLGVANLGPYLLRRPEVYEVAISGALCFATAALLLFALAGLRERRAPWLLAGGSLCAGLAFGCRPNIGLVVAGAAFVLVWWRRAGLLRSRAVRNRMVALGLGPFGLCVALVGIYNAVRFGSPADFGLQHQLAIEDQSFRPHVSGAYLPPNLWYYVIGPPRLRVQFPYVFFPPPPYTPVNTPATYGSSEPTGGLLTTMPILVLLALAPIALRAQARELKEILAGLAAFGVALLLFISVFFWASTMRYEADFRTPLLIVTLVIAAAALAIVRRSWQRRLLVGAAGVLAAWTIAVTALASLSGEKNYLAQQRPALWHRLERFFSPLPTAVAQVAGRPLLAAVNGDANLVPYRYDRLSLDGTEFSLGRKVATIQVVAPGNGVATLSATLRRLPAARGLGAIRVGVGAHRTGNTNIPTGRRVKWTVRLEQGLNEMIAEVATERPIRLPPGAPAAEELVRLSDLRFTGWAAP
jgi:hypothetical protein